MFDIGFGRFLENGEVLQNSTFYQIPNGPEGRVIVWVSRDDVERWELRRDRKHSLCVLFKYHRAAKGNR